MGKKIWRLLDPLREHKAEVDEIAAALNVSEITAALLYNRGQTDVAKARNFVGKESELFCDAFLLKDMDKAVARLFEALDKREKIAIYGDYDVDGVTSVSALYLYLKDKGANVGYYIPTRSGEGYGINEAAIDLLRGRGYTLMITVDTGITAVSEVRHSMETGLDVIVTDHHECQSELPPAVAVVNPRRPDCDYPFRDLAGVGVVFKFMCAIEQTFDRRRGSSENYLRTVTLGYGDLVAIGTVADVMPLVGENRLIVSLGMELIERSPRPGIAALLELSGNSADHPLRPQKKRRVTSSLIGYTIAPRINAAGRIANASIAVEMFLTDSPARARRIAAQLCEINRSRQAEENKIIEEAYRKIEAEHDFSRDYVIVLDEDDWHQGVIGIVASRITEHYNLPSILISFDGDIGKGSGRSVKGLNLVDALHSCEDCLIKYGGHELAAGLSIERSKLAEFKRRINDYARANLKPEDLATSIPVDCEIGAKDITLALANELYMLEPYGVANPVPVFALRDAVIADVVPIGLNRHTRLTLEKDGCRITSVYFGAVASELDFVPGDHVDVIFNLDINDFQNVQTVQIIVRDLVHSQAYTSELERQKRVYGNLRSGKVTPAAAAADGLEVVPLREDFIAVYLYLRKETRAGRDCLTLHSIARGAVNASNSTPAPGAPLGVRTAPPASPEKKQKINYVKARLIIDIMSETNLIDAQRCDDGLAEKYVIRLNNITNKINLEKSTIYRRLMDG